MKRLSMMKRTSWMPVGALLLFSGCVDEQSSIFVERVASYNPESCVATTTDPALPFGLLDLGVDDDEVYGYDASLVVTTNLPSTVNQQTIQEGRQLSPNYPNYGPGDSSVVNFTSVRVYFMNSLGDVLDVGGITAENRRETAVGGVLYNNQTALGQQALLLAPLISKEETQLFREREGTDLNGQGGLSVLEDDPDNRFRVLANVQVVGKTNGGAQIVSPEYTFPIDLCKRCLTRVGVPSGETDCNADEKLTPTENVCFVGQDYVSTKCEPTANE